MILTLPKIKPVAAIEFQEPEMFSLDNGIPVYGFNSQGNDALKISINFDAGRWTESKQLQAAYCAELLKSGHHASAFEIAEVIDFIGGTIKAYAGYNSFTIELYCISRNLETLLQQLQSILQETIFPEDEIQLAKENRLSQLKMNQIKNDYRGEMAFKEKIFGAHHPYGYVTTEENIKAVQQKDILAYYQNNIGIENCEIGIIGKYSSNEIDLLNKYLGNQSDWKKNYVAKQFNPSIETSSELTCALVIPDSVQASIFIGNLTIQRNHEDYIGYYFLNLILGGYFGSRLMSNLREDKGLTYGIHSYIQNYRHASIFAINTETATSNIEICLKEIYFEIDRLKDQLIPTEELVKARNYLLGRLLDQVDGPFKTAGTFFGLKTHQLQLDYLKKMEKVIKALQPDELQQIAQKYMDSANLFEVVAK